MSDINYQFQDFPKDIIVNENNKKKYGILMQLWQYKYEATGNICSYYPEGITLSPDPEAEIQALISDLKLITTDAFETFWKKYRIT
jgi:hypothetical protein